jgi:hypothetical protein
VLLMPTPRWYRGGPSWLWGVVIALALALALWLAGRATVATIRQDERAKVLTEGERLAAWSASLERAHWQRLTDSLRREAARVDTVLDTVLVRVRVVTQAPIPTAPDSVRAALLSCRGVLDSLATTCAQFRAVATAALAAADTVRRRDSLSVVGARMTLVQLQDQVQRLEKRPRWRMVAGALLVGVVAGVVR